MPLNIKNKTYFLDLNWFIVKIILSNLSLNNLCKSWLYEPNSFEDLFVSLIELNKLDVSLLSDNPFKISLLDLISSATASL